SPTRHTAPTQHYPLSLHDALPISVKKVTPIQMAAYLEWLEKRHGLAFDDYESLYRWSVTDLDAFWGSIREYFQLLDEGAPEPVLVDDRMPGARWFPGLSLNYAEQALRHAGVGDPRRPAIVHRSESGHDGEL